MSRSISLPTNKRDGPRPYRPSLGSAAAAVVPVSRASILRNNMMMVGAKNNERNVSRSMGRAPRRSTLQSIRKSLANDNMALQRHNLPRACGFFLHGENFSSDGGCGYDPRAPRFIGYHGETARSTGSALPLAMPKTISRPLSGSFRAFQRPIGPGRKGEDCEGCTCVDGGCWGAPEPLEYYDHSRQKDVRSVGAGSRVSIVKNISVQDTNHRLSQSVSVHVRADSVDRSSQTDEEENRNSHLHLSMKQLSRQSMSGLFPAEKKRSQSYPEHLPRGQNTGGGNAKRYGSSDSELEGAVSMEDHNSSRRRKRSFTNPGTDRLSDHRKLGLPTDGRSLPSKQQSRTNKTILHKPSDGTDLHTDDRDTIQLPRDYIQQLISEVEQQQQDEMDEDGSDDDDLVENGQLERRPKEPSDRNRPLHYHKYSEQSGKTQIEHEPAGGQTRRSRFTRAGKPDRADDFEEGSKLAKGGEARREGSGESADRMSDRSDVSLGDRASKGERSSRGREGSGPQNKRQRRRDRDEEGGSTRKYSDPVRNAARFLKQVQKQPVERLRRNERANDEGEVFSEHSLAEPWNRRNRAERRSNDARDRDSRTGADRSLQSVTSLRSDVSLLRGLSKRPELNGNRQKERPSRRSSEEFSRRESYPSHEARSQRSDGQKRRQREASEEEDGYVAGGGREDRNWGRTGSVTTIDGARPGGPRSAASAYRRDGVRRRTENAVRRSAEDVVRRVNSRSKASEGSRDQPSRSHWRRDTFQPGQSHRKAEGTDRLRNEGPDVEPGRKRASVSYGSQSQIDRARSEPHDGRRNKAARARRTESVDRAYAEGNVERRPNASRFGSRPSRSSLRRGIAQPRKRKPRAESMDHDRDEDRAADRETDRKRARASYESQRRSNRARSVPYDRYESKATRARKSESADLGQADPADDMKYNRSRTSAGARNRSDSNDQLDNRLNSGARPLSATRDQRARRRRRTPSIGRGYEEVVATENSGRALARTSGEARSRSSRTAERDNTLYRERTRGNMNDSNTGDLKDRGRTASPVDRGRHSQPLDRGGASERDTRTDRRHLEDNVNGFGRRRMTTSGRSRGRSGREGHRDNAPDSRESIDGGHTGNAKSRGRADSPADREGRSQSLDRRAVGQPRTRTIDRDYAEDGSVDDLERKKTSRSRANDRLGTDDPRDGRSNRKQARRSVDRINSSDVDSEEKAGTRDYPRTATRRSRPNDGRSDVRERNKASIDQGYAKDTVNDRERERSSPSGEFRGRRRPGSKAQRDDDGSTRRKEHSQRARAARNDVAGDSRDEPGRRTGSTSESRTKHPRSQLDDNNIKTDRVSRGYAADVENDLDRRITDSPREARHRLAEPPFVPTRQRETVDGLRKSGSVERGFLEEETVDFGARERKSPLVESRIIKPRTEVDGRFSKVRSGKTERNDNEDFAPDADIGKRKPEGHVAPDEEETEHMDRSRRAEAKGQSELHSEADRNKITLRKAAGWDGQDATDDSEDVEAPSRRTAAPRAKSQKNPRRASLEADRREMAESDSGERFDEKQLSKEKDPTRHSRLGELEDGGQEQDRSMSGVGEKRILKDDDDAKNSQSPNGTSDHDRKTVGKQVDGDDVADTKRALNKHENKERRRKFPADPNLDEEAALLKIHKFKEKHQNHPSRRSKKRNTESELPDDTPEDFLEEQAASEVETKAASVETKDGKSEITTDKSEGKVPQDGSIFDVEKRSISSQLKRAFGDRQRVDSPDELSPRSPSDGGLTKGPFRSRPRKDNEHGINNDDHDQAEVTPANHPKRSRGEDQRSMERQQRILLNSPPLSGEDSPSQAGKAGRDGRISGETYNESLKKPGLHRSDEADINFKEATQHHHNRDSGKHGTANEHRSGPKHHSDEEMASDDAFGSRRGPTNSKPRKDDRVADLSEKDMPNERRGKDEDRERSEDSRRDRRDKRNDEAIEDDEPDIARKTSGRPADKTHRKKDVDRHLSEDRREGVRRADEDDSAPRKQGSRRSNGTLPDRDETGPRRPTERADSLEEQTHRTDFVREDSLDRPDRPDKVTKNDRRTTEKRRSSSERRKPGLSREHGGRTRTLSARKSVSVDSRGSDKSDSTTESVRSTSDATKKEARQSRESKRRAERRKHNIRDSRSREEISETGAKKDGSADSMIESRQRLPAGSSANEAWSGSSMRSSIIRSRTSRKKDKKEKITVDERDHSAHSVSHLHENDTRAGIRTKTVTRERVDKKLERRSSSASGSLENPSKSRDRKRNANKEVSSTEMNVNRLQPDSSRNLHEVFSSDHSDGSSQSNRKGKQGIKSAKNTSDEGGKSRKRSKKNEQDALKPPDTSSSSASVISRESSVSGTTSLHRSSKIRKDKGGSPKAERSSRRAAHPTRSDREDSGHSAGRSERSKSWRKHSSDVWDEDAKKAREREGERARIDREDHSNHARSPKSSKKRPSEIWEVDVEKVRSLNDIDALLYSKQHFGKKNEPTTDAELVKEITERMSAVQFKTNDGDVRKRISLNSLDSPDRRSGSRTEHVKRSRPVESDEDARRTSEIRHQTDVHMAKPHSSMMHKQSAEQSAGKRTKTSGEVKRHKALEEAPSEDGTVIDSGTRRLHRERHHSHSHDHSVHERSTDKPSRKESEKIRTSSWDTLVNDNNHHRHVHHAEDAHRKERQKSYHQPEKEESSFWTSHDKGSLRNQHPQPGVEQKSSALPMVSRKDPHGKVLAHQAASAGGFSVPNERSRTAYMENGKERRQERSVPPDQAVRSLTGQKPMADSQRTAQRQIVEEESSCGMVSGVYSEESCECEESVEVLRDQDRVTGALNRERQEFISKAGKRVIFIPAASNNTETRDEPFNGKGNFMAEKDPAVTSETSLIMQRLDSLSVPKVTHDQSEQTAQAETARPVRHQSEQTVQEVQPRKVFRDIGEQTTKQVTRDEGEQTLPPRRVSQDRGEQTAKLLTREEADQTSRRMLRDVAEQTTRRMSKDEAEQTMQVVKEILQRNASPRREGPEDRRIVPFKSSSQMFEPVTNQVDKFNNTRTNSKVEEKRLPPVESESRTDHGSAENDKDDWVKGNRVVDGYNVRPTMDTREDYRSRAKPQKKEVFEGDSETITDSSDCTLSDGEYVTNPRLARITLSQLDRKRKKRKARRKRGVKRGNQEATSSAEHTEEEVETEEDEEDGLVPGRRRSRGQVVTLEYESVTEFVDASNLHPTHLFHQSKFGTFNPAIYPSESQHSDYSNAEVHRTESAGQFDYHEIEEDGIELDVSVSQGSEHGELPHSHVAREDIVKLPDILGGNKRGS
ncbi:hypothetical protein RvY_10065 [Ramazzottius varieornatus]|uniref:Uncharacterized protein n=1 Tax=Ramazzottius varieornatus TaxID=947166 RepID=A0A1D1VJB1_RAMVA|nr:hypothetical protein RvY_10065 [Ramazzottius varieornatus]